MEPEQIHQRVPIRELARYYLRLGLVGFGGPVALVGQMEREMGGDKKWPRDVIVARVAGLLEDPALGR